MIVVHIAGTFQKPWGERIYVTWYAISVFIIPFVILVVTHYYICREIWLNLHKKRKSFKINKRERYQSNDTTNRRQDFESESMNETESNSQQTISAKTLVSIGKSYRFKGRGKLEVSLEKNFKEDFSPRSHSIHGLSRAKIKTVKITVVVILCYIMCSTPFICVQLWAYWVPTAQESHIWNVKYYQCTFIFLLVKWFYDCIQLSYFISMIPTKSKCISYGVISKTELELRIDWFSLQSSRDHKSIHFIHQSISMNQIRPHEMGDKGGPLFP